MEKLDNFDNLDIHDLAWKVNDIIDALDSFNLRHFKKVSTYESIEFKLPERSTKGSAGYDFVSLDNVVINPGESFIFKTGVKVEMDLDEVLMIYPRSSFGIKKNLMLMNTVGCIDHDYYNNPDNEGLIMIAYYNYGKLKQEIKVGDKIAQGIFIKYLTTYNDNADKKRIGGIGSTL